MKLSHSRVECFNKCPYQFKLRYIDKLETLPTDDPTSALILGHALHTGIEKNTEASIEEYYNAYPVINDNHVTEAIKLEYWIPKIKEAIPPGGLHEIEIADGEDFVGYIDYLVPVDDQDLVCDYCSKNCDCGYAYSGQKCKKYEIYDLYDWKYSNNVKNYMESGQLHEYKYFFEKLNPNKKIRNMYFMFVPKCNLKIKYKNKTNPKDETIQEFRKRVFEDLESKQLEFVEVKYDPNKVIEFLNNGIHAINCVEYIKNPSRLCDWCQFQRYCEKGEDLDMQLPKNERISNSEVTKRKIWLYGAPFSGKTYLANSFPDMLLLSTDGNYTQLPGGIPPHIDIKDIVTVEGRITKKQFAWEVLKDVISELEKKQNDFKTIVLDLIEDTYEQCRLYMYDQLGITHESDDSFRAWDKVRTEYLSTIKRLMNLNYENIILISHEDTSKDIMKKSGDKITSIKPNLGDKPALKIAGMVDLVARVVADDNNRVISFKTNEVIFGGGRLNVQVNEIPCEYEELMKVYDEANSGASKVVESKPARQKKKEVREEMSEPKVEVSPSVEESSVKEVEVATATPVETETPEQPVRRTRKPREVVKEDLGTEVKIESTGEVAKVESTPSEETPVRRRRRRVEE